MEYGLERAASDMSDNSFTYRSGTNALEAIGTARRLYESGLVEWAGPDWITPMDDSTLVPEDEQFQQGEQWNLEAVGLPAAWDRTRGVSDWGRPSRIAIIDKGVQIRHQDLHSNHLVDGATVSWDYFGSFNKYGLPKIDSEGQPVVCQQPARHLLVSAQ